MRIPSALAGSLVAVCLPCCVGAAEPTPTPIFQGISFPLSLVAAACDETSAEYPELHNFHFTGATQVVGALHRQPSSDDILLGFMCVYADHNGGNRQTFFVGLDHPRYRSAEAIRQFALARGLKLHEAHE